MAGDAAAVEAAPADAAHVARVEPPFTRLAMCQRAPRMALGAYREGRHTLTCGTQNPWVIRQVLACDALGCDEAALRIVTPYMGGAIGTRSGVFPEMAFVPCAAQRFGRPLR